MKYFIVVLLLTFDVIASASEYNFNIDNIIRFDQVNIGFTGNYENAQADNFDVEQTIIQNGLDTYVKTTLFNKTKANFGCVVGYGKEVRDAFGTRELLTGKYAICTYYVGFYEWKR